jgi:hypothetical protein
VRTEWGKTTIDILKRAVDDSSSSSFYATPYSPPNQSKIKVDHPPPCIETAALPTLSTQRPPFDRQSSVLISILDLSFFLADFASSNGVRHLSFIDSEGLSMALTWATPADDHSLTLVGMAPGSA